MLLVVEGDKYNINAFSLDFLLQKQLLSPIDVLYIFAKSSISI